MADQYHPVTAAAVQAAPVFLNRDQTLEKACDLIIEAGNSDADVTVFPEGFIPGHPLWYHFHAATSDVSKHLATELFKNAVEVPGPVTQRLAQAAEQAGTYVTMGVCEKEPNTTGTMYNSQLFFSPDGELIGKHQKLKPTVGEQLVHAEGKKHTFGTVQAEFGPMSGLICGENSNPLAIFALSAEHTRIHSMSWPPSFGWEGAMREKIRTFSRAFAQMSKAYVVSATGVLDDRMVDMLELDEEEAEKVRDPENSGGSVIVGPDLEVVSKSSGNDEEILYGDLDLEVGVVRKLTHDFAGHYNRPDVFQLRLDRSRDDIVTEPASTSADDGESVSNGQSRRQDGIEPAGETDRSQKPDDPVTEDRRRPQRSADSS